MNVENLIIFIGFFFYPRPQENEGIMKVSDKYSWVTSLTISEAIYI